MQNATILFLSKEFSSEYLSTASRKIISLYCLNLQDFSHREWRKKNHATSFLYQDLCLTCYIPHHYEACTFSMCNTVIVQFSSVQSLWLTGSSEDMRDNSAEILFQFFFSFFSAGGPCEQFWLGQGCPLFDVVHPAFPLPTTASSTL